MKKTKIIATIWPVTADEKSIISLFENWINVIRFNFSHADYEWTKKVLKIIKKLNKEWKTELSTLLDTKWPEIRTGVVEKPIKIVAWEKYKIYTDKNLVKDNDIFCDYPFLIKDCKIGQKIIIDSGLLQTIVVDITKDYVEIKAENSTELGSRRHINLPWVHLHLPWITPQDEKDIKFALENDFDFIAASFIRNKEWIQKIRKLFEEYDNNYIKLISKIENEEAIENLDEIISLSDWVMVARWDLGIEVPIQKLPIYQSEIVNKSKTLGKFVIIATHLLETMIQNPFPTRAESSDIFNSVLQWPDALMLSWETTTWKFPIESAQMMTKIIKEAEIHSPYTYSQYSNNWLNERNIEKKTLISSWIELWQELQAEALIVMTKTWLLARLTWAFHPNIPVFAFTNSKQSLWIMRLYYGINPIYLKWWDQKDYSKTLDKAISYLLEKEFISKKAKIIAITDLQKWKKEIPVLEIINVKELFL